MKFSPKQISVKSEYERAYTPCQVEIENGFLSFQKMGLAAGIVGGLAGIIVCEQAKRTNEVVRIPLTQITSVETKTEFFDKQVVVRAAGFPVYIFSSDMNKNVKQIAALLRGNGSNNPQPKPRSVVLQVTAGARAGAAFRFQEGHTVILGRDPSRCNLPLSEYTTISGCHCCLELSGTGLTVTDLGSTNGTWLNGVRLLPNHPTAVPDGSELWLANKSCILQVKFD